MRNKILVFGDSITFGAWDKDCGGWVNRIRLSIDNDEKIASCHVFNLGISGQITGEIHERIGDESLRRFREDANNVIVIAAGINDTQIIGGKVRTSETDFNYNVRSLIREAKKYTGHVIYIGLTAVDEARTNPIWFDRTLNWRNCYIEAYDEIIQKICQDEGAEYVKLFDKIDTIKMMDGLHPSSDGHKDIADIIRPVIYKYIIA